MTDGKAVLLLFSFLLFFYDFHSGVLQPKDDCDDDRWQFIREQHVIASEKLFSDSLTFKDEEEKAPEYEPNGGWADPRDVDMCMNMVK